MFKNSTDVSVALVMKCLEDITKHIPSQEEQHIVLYHSSCPCRKILNEPRQINCTRQTEASPYLQASLQFGSLRLVRNQQLPPRKLQSNVLSRICWLEILQTDSTMYVYSEYGWIISGTAHIQTHLQCTIHWWKAFFCALATVNLKGRLVAVH